MATREKQRRRARGGPANGDRYPSITEEEVTAELDAAIARGDFRPLGDRARRTAGTSAISIRVPVSVLAVIRTLAVERGVPYQRLINTWLAEAAAASKAPRRRMTLTPAQVLELAHLAEGDEVIVSVAAPVRGPRRPHEMTGLTATEARLRADLNRQTPGWKQLRTVPATEGERVRVTYDRRMDAMAAALKFGSTGEQASSEAAEGTELAPEEEHAVAGWALYLVDVGAGPDYRVVPLIDTPAGRTAVTALRSGPHWWIVGRADNPAADQLRDQAMRLMFLANGASEAEAERRVAEWRRAMATEQADEQK